MRRKKLVAVMVLLFTLGTAAHALEISTAFGSGADTFVGNDSKTSSTTVRDATTQLECRYNGGGSRFTSTYLRFDISQETRDFTGTLLSLNESWAKGTARTLQVYGLVDETLDLWDSSITCYQNAPGMLQPASGWNTGDYLIDDIKLTLLGTITVPTAPEGTSSKGGTVNVVFTSDPTLLDLGSFLNLDTNDLVTLVLINADGTSGTNSEDRFASKEYGGEYMAPTLITPEPATLSLLGLGCLMTIRRKRS